ncbi:MAG: hypothetical protein JW943_07850 [Deltaproteobacteria bacterium]|nr:hypothetical protein [Deltaproteobacteria bacterium]
MFVGSINSKIKNLIYSENEIFQGQKVCVGCSGNFTVEQILSGLDCEIWSNDISLYSSLIGNHLAGKPMRAEIREPRYFWLNPYMEKGGVDRIAAVSLLFEMLKHEKRNNLNQIRLYDHYKNNFGAYHEQSCARISRALETIKIADYSEVDVHELYSTLPPEWIRIAFLPTYIAGYEKLYARLDEIISWDRPVYEMLTTERHEETVGFMRKGQYLYLADYDRGEDGLYAIVKTGRLKNIYLYSNLPFAKAFIKPHSNSKKGNYAFLPDDYQITRDGKISILPTDNQHLNYYKNLFLKKGIDHTAGMSPFLVFLDGYLFGFLLFDIIRYGMDQEKSSRGIYMLSDFIISHPVKRLSKLLLLVTKSKELREMLKKKFIQNVDFILTTAFTDKPVSMKYRGVYSLLKRGEGYLQYATDCGEFTLQESLNIWIKKYGKSSKN